MSGIDSWRSLREACEKYGATSITVPALVEALTAPLARVEALVDEWEDVGVTEGGAYPESVVAAEDMCARVLRAALAAAPSREGES